MPQALLVDLPEDLSLRAATSTTSTTWSVCASQMTATLPSAALLWQPMAVDHIAQPRYGVKFSHRITSLWSGPEGSR